MTINHRTRVVAGLAVAAGALVPAFSAVTAEGAEHAGAAIVDTAGRSIGFAKFTEDGTGGMHVNVKVTGLSPGLHGIHIHGIGSCVTGTTPAFSSASSHHNPLVAAHGAHAGDLPNLVADTDGRGVLNAHLERFTLSAGATSVLDADGSAIVIHALPDDFVTQPTGGSGGRVACGVIVAGD